MQKVDVLFIYETKVRELENICLLKYELERRGYSVGIINTWNYIGRKDHPYKAKVVVTHAMYHDGIYSFVKNICGDIPKVVNMQCEQVGTIKDDEGDDSRFILKGVAKECMNICWGENTVKRLTEKSGIDQKHIRKTGQITLDFCRKELRDYYLKRDEIISRYNLPNDCSLNLFISSFAYVNLPEAIEKQSDISDKDFFIDFSKKSFDGLLSWFERIIKEDSNQAIIYRPHPAEADNERLKELCQKYPDRFFVISELSVKQWIAVSDKVYTWFSTSAAEAYTFDVPCAVLRPVELVGDKEVSIFKNASFITDYEAFKHSIQNGFKSSIDKQVFENHYSIEQTMSYIRVADAIEDVLKDDDFLIKNAPKEPKSTFIQKIKKVAHNSIGLVANCLPETLHFLDKYRKKKVVLDEYALKLQRNNAASEEEILEIQNKIAKILCQQCSKNV